MDEPALNQHLTSEAHVNIIWKLGSYFTGSTQRVHYKYEQVNAVASDGTCALKGNQYHIAHNEDQPTALAGVPITLQARIPWPLCSTVDQVTGCPEIFRRFPQFLKATTVTITISSASKETDIWTLKNEG